MNTFDRHLLREWLQILALVLVATLGLLMVNVLYDDFRELRDIGARGATIWLYVGVTIPSFFSLVLPLALLVSLLYALGKLHRANEITAMRAAGVGFLRLTAPIWTIGILCCGLVWWLNTTVVPWSVEYSRAIRENLSASRQAQHAQSPDEINAVNSVAFDHQLARRMWFFDRYSRYTRRGYGVAVSELDAQRREQRRLVAAQAWYDPERDGWEFKAGREIVFNPETRESVASTPFADKFVAGYHERPGLMLLIDRKPADLLLGELRRLIAYLETEHSPKVVAYAVRYYGLLANTLSPLIVIAIAVPFAMAGVRVNPAVGVSKSIGLFFLYYVLTNFSASLATKHLLDPAVAAWLPYASMTALGIWLFARLR